MYAFIVLSVVLTILLRVSCTEDRASLDLQYQKWLLTYKAANPQHQNYCMNVLSGVRERAASQFGQDMFMFFNIFKYWPMQGKKGFYVDSGANDARKLSNSFFFDVCLGWDGLCVEPMEMYHQEIRQLRTCLLVPECISDKEETRSWVHATTGSRIQNDGEKNPGQKVSTVKCMPLKNMLALSKDKNRNSIDLWSLDVEGHEITVLESTNFNDVKVSALLVENSHINQCKLDAVLWKRGFHKYEQLIIDGVYINNATSVLNEGNHASHLSSTSASFPNSIHDTNCEPFSCN